MYSQKIVAQKAAAIESAFPIKLKEYSVSEVDGWLHHLGKLVHPDSKPGNPKLLRDLSDEEKSFISNEIMLCKISYRYWAERYAWIKPDKGGETRIKFWESQEILLNTISRLEEELKPILIINLKARQVGSSTISESILTHKALNCKGTTSLVASDEPSKSEFLFNMMLRIYQKLPFYLQPHRRYEVKGTQLVFDTLDSYIVVDSGNKRAGGMGQGMTVHSGHLSELATWQYPEMIIEDLFPAVFSGASPNTFFILESTAKGKGGTWNTWWVNAKRQKFHDFTPVFIPWWAIKEKYASDPPEGWGPSDRVMMLAMSLKSTQGVEITRKQMYWWDKKYESHKEEGTLAAFFAEYASDDEEAFQLSGRGIFPLEQIQDLRRAAKARPLAVYEIQEKALVR